MEIVVVLTIIQIIIGLLYANMMEWVLHNLILHKIGKNKKSFFSFHWHGHHKNSRKQKFYDSDYEASIWTWNARGKEALGLFIVWLLHTWTFFLFPIFAITITYCVINYYFTHKWAHQHPGWAKKNLRWHWEHHQGKNQDANFCVTQPWFDYIMGTRVKYREEEVNGKMVLRPIDKNEGKFVEKHASK